MFDFGDHLDPLKPDGNLPHNAAWWLPFKAAQPLMFCSSDRQSSAVRWALSEWMRQWPW